MSETKEVTLKVEKESTEPVVDPKKVEAAMKAFVEFQKELGEKEYLVPGGETTGKALIQFLEDKAEWNSHEALGIVRAHEDITKALKAAKKGQLFLGNLCIEAVAYYVSKSKGTGLKEALAFKEHIFMPINEAMAKINEDKKKLENLQLEWAAAAQGVNLEDLDNQEE